MYSNSGEVDGVLYKYVIICVVSICENNLSYYVNVRLESSQSCITLEGVGMWNVYLICTSCNLYWYLLLREVIIV